MSHDLVVSQDVKDRQRRAADPAVSVWVSANAGAGKTKVLTDRVIRILLAGTPPDRILCLTFTKAAAAEMTIRIFDTLGEWVTLDEPALRLALRNMTGAEPGRAALKTARQLFARAVETPGGLKIETIHAFCERLLHLVPFEAGVAPGFVVLDQEQSSELMREARDAMLAEAAGARGGDLARDLDTVAALAAGPRLPALLAESVADPRIPEGPDALDRLAGDVATALGVQPGESAASLRRAMLEDGIPRSEWMALAATIRERGSSDDAARATTLELAARAADPNGRLVHYLSVFFTDKGPPRKDVVTRGHPKPLRARLDAEQARLDGCRNRLFAAEAVERSLALFRLAGAVRAKIADIKLRLGALDFDDLIRTTLALLERGHGAWVLYRLDRGVDHVLVDEAQDTNPDQWRILQLLTEEFTAGAGRPVRGPRTVFAVGDPKQSIYSFQGADPREFEASRLHWRGRHAEAGLAFAEVRLDLSFRSAQVVLDAVDATFAVATHYNGLAFGGDTAIGTRHVAARRAAPGRVEIWPIEMPGKVETPDDAWALPLDLLAPDSPAVAAAERVASAVRTWTQPGDPDGPGGGRRWHPGDILILARKRGPAFFAVIRALKAAGVRVAGADRIDIGEQIAVADLVAAGSAALLPENDLVLAAALKSPLVGLDDDDLIRIAADRPDGEPLAAALIRAGAAGDARAADGAAALTRWQDLARTRGPFGFFATLLGPEGGRSRLVERLGGEAADAIDVFLSRAQSDEFGVETSSLTAFLSRFEAAEHVVRRDPEAAGDQVRVMTVHGAKGLEAPLVVLLDGSEIGGPDPALLGLPSGPAGNVLPVWALGQQTDPPALAAARAAHRDRALEEHNRLLYVALTRARDRLVIVPFADRRGLEPKPQAWGRMVRIGLEAHGRGLVATEMPYGPVDEWHDPPASTATFAPSPAAGASTRLPDWLRRPVVADREPVPPIRPSGPLAAADRPDPDREPGLAAEARARGTWVHDLITHLADVGRDDSGQDLDAAATSFWAGREPIAEAGAITAEALAVVRHPALADLFGPGSRGEAAVAGRIGPPGRERPVSGRIDRVAVGDDAVWVADFKTGTPVSPAPAAYLGQLAIYRDVLAGIWPDRPIHALLVWTSGPTIVEPTQAELAAGLHAVLAGLP